MKSAFEVLARKAWAKVRLDQVRNSPDEFTAALKEFRAANREAKQMDAEEIAAGAWDEPEQQMNLI